MFGDALLGAHLGKVDAGIGVHENFIDFTIHVRKTLCILSDRGRICFILYVCHLKLFLIDISMAIMWGVDALQALDTIYALHAPFFRMCCLIDVVLIKMCMSYIGWFGMMGCWLFGLNLYLLGHHLGCVRECPQLHYWRLLRVLGYPCPLPRCLKYHHCCLLLLCACRCPRSEALRARLHVRRSCHHDVYHRH